MGYTQAGAPMKEEYIRLILEQDKVISAMRMLWGEAKDAAEKAKWRVQIDQALDERLRLMRCRDAATLMPVLDPLSQP
jgi:primosomal protein N''